LCVFRAPLQSAQAVWGKVQNILVLLPVRPLPYPRSKSSILSGSGKSDFCYTAVVLDEMDLRFSAAENIRHYVRPDGASLQ
jgi:hypothetical protein